MQMKPLDEWPDKARAIYEAIILVVSGIVSVVVYRYIFC